MQNGSWTVVAFIAAFTFSVFSQAGAEETLELQSFPPVQRLENEQPTTTKSCTPECEEKCELCHGVVEKALMLMKTPGGIIIQEEEEEPLLLHFEGIPTTGVRACGCEVSICKCNESKATPVLKVAHSSATPKARTLHVPDGGTVLHGGSIKRRATGLRSPAVRQASFEIEEPEAVRNITDQSATDYEVVDTFAVGTESTDAVASDKDEKRNANESPRVKKLIEQLATRSQHNRATLNVPVPSETSPPLRIDFKGKANEQVAQPSPTRPQTCPCQKGDCRWKVVETASASEGCSKTCGDSCAKSCSGVCCDSNCASTATLTNSELITICSEIESFDEYVSAMAMIVDSATRNSQQPDLNKALVALATAKMETMIHAVEMESEMRQAMHESELEMAKLEAVVEANQTILELTSESLQLLMATGAARQASFPQNYVPASALPRAPVPTRSIPPMIRPSAYNQVGPVTTWNAVPEYGVPTPYAPQTRVANLPPANPPANPAVHSPNVQSSMPIHQSAEEARAFSFHMDGGAR